MIPVWMKGALCVALVVATLPAADDMATVREVLARDNSDAWAANELRQAIIELDPARRPGALALVAQARRSEFLPVARDLLAVSDPAVVSASIGVLAASWPSRAGDAEAVRRLISHGDATIAAAAMAFATQIQDDLAVPLLADRLLAHPGNATIEQALVDLTGHAAGDGNDWHAWHREETTRVLHLIDQLQPRVTSDDPKDVMVAVSLLLGERSTPGLIADELLMLADHPDAQVRNLVRSALAVNPSVAAACWRAEQGSGDAVAFPAPPEGVAGIGSPTSHPAPSAVGGMAASTVDSSSARAGSSVGAGLVVVLGLVGTIWWWRRSRTPAEIVPAPKPALPADRKKPRISVTWAE